MHVTSGEGWLTGGGRTGIKHTGVQQIVLTAYEGTAEFGGRRWIFSGATQR